MWWQVEIRNHKILLTRSLRNDLQPHFTNLPIGTEPHPSQRAGSFKRTETNGTKGTGTDVYLVDLNQKSLEQVQMLTYKNGYLESQLLEREKDIAERDQNMKLLTDNQQISLWSRFCAWFLSGG